MTKRIVISGGGASAVSSLAHPAGDPGVERITFVAPTPIGLGTAFGTTDPLLLCYTSVDATSQVADGRSDFTGACGLASFVHEDAEPLEHSLSVLHEVEDAGSLFRVTDPGN
ncbi:hypothetical protein AB0L74_33545 [Streptomyces sp. NPDC052020]|uniref:hypothetical protein n=1 Tax=Streptomyces sp. NPDC052020 TaxID=3155677 RepID=UPI0034306D28